MPKQAPYRWLAKYYDLVFGEFHAPMDRAREQILEKILPETEVACDLACGTGTTALKLARQGIRMYGVDLSPGMCRAAREKARQAKVRLPVLCAPMQEFRLPEAMDLILCEYDALNHVGKGELGKVLGAVAQALRPGGHFYFDVNNRAGFGKYWCGVFVVEKPGLMLVMRNGSEAKYDHAWSDVTWFVKEGTLWRRHTERVEEVCWSGKEMREALRQAGFEKVRAWDAEPFFGDGFVERGCRTVYLARKAGV